MMFNRISVYDIASSYGQKYIHGAGGTENFFATEQNKFLETMADEPNFP